MKPLRRASLVGCLVLLSHILQLNHCDGYSFIAVLCYSVIVFKYIVSCIPSFFLFSCRSVQISVHDGLYNLIIMSKALCTPGAYQDICTSPSLSKGSPALPFWISWYCCCINYSLKLQYVIVKKNKTSFFVFNRIYKYFIFIAEHMI